MSREAPATDTEPLDDAEAGALALRANDPAEGLGDDPDADDDADLLPAAAPALPGAEVLRRLEAAELRRDRPPLHPGDAVRVHATIREGDRERVQVFEGILIALKHGGNRRTITVRKTSFGIPVERIFPLHSPLVAKIEVVRSHHVRRAKLYFLRDRKGKAARLREKRR